MLYDYENNYIGLNANSINHNILVLGSSGSGKTFFSMNKCLEEADKKHRVCILDGIDSYSWDQFANNNIRTEEINIIELKKWYLNFDSVEGFIDEVTDSLVETLIINSYKQRCMINKFCACCYKKYKFINIKTIFHMIEEFINNGGYMSKDELHMAEFLYQKLRLYKELDIEFCYKKEADCIESGIYVINLSFFSIKDRNMLAKLLVELIWRETKKGHRKFDFLVLDEFQYMKVEDGTLEIMLREARKYNLRIMLLTQLLYNFRNNDINLLMQVGNILVFKTTAKEARYISRELNDDNNNEWEKILRKLNRGEVVIYGNYVVNNSLEGSTPIICRVNRYKERMV